MGYGFGFMYLRIDDKEIWSGGLNPGDDIVKVKTGYSHDKKHLIELDITGFQESYYNEIYTNSDVKFTLVPIGEPYEPPYITIKVSY